MSADTTFNILNLQLRALADIQRKLQANSDRLVRLENKLEQVSRDVDRLARKESNE